MAQDDTRTAIYDAIKKVAEDSKEYSGTTASAMVRDVAMAYRFVAGGPQPGGLHIDK